MKIDFVVFNIFLISFVNWRGHSMRKSGLRDIAILCGLVAAALVAADGPAVRASPCEESLPVARHAADYGQEESSRIREIATPAETRQELWRQKRLEKLLHSKPSEKTKLEKVFLWLEEKDLENLVHYQDFYLKLGNLSTGSGFAPGVRYRKPKIQGTSLEVQSSAAISARGYQLYDLQFGKGHGAAREFFVRANSPGPTSEFGDVPEYGRRWFLYADAGYRYFPQEDFFGIGPQSRKRDRTAFLLEEASYDVVVGYQWNRWWGIAARAGFLQVNTGGSTDGRFADTRERFTDLLAPGLDQQPAFFRWSSALLFDYRDQPGNPHNGCIVGITLSRFDDRGNRGFAFTRFAFDGRHYYSVGSTQRVLALRFFTSFDDPDANSRVPFYFQDTLGGSDTLRGFREFRFRDANLLYLSAEYRWEAAPALEFALFYDAGKVFGDRSDFDFRRLEKSFGGGIRFKTSKTVIARIDVGRSKEGTRVYFKFGPSF